VVERWQRDEFVERYRIIMPSAKLDMVEEEEKMSGRSPPK
jgi:myosin heavy subunit